MNVNRVTEHWSCVGRIESPRSNLSVVTFREKRNVTCLCNCCGAWLIFEAQRAGEMVNCPECLMGTILHAPQESVPYAPGEPDFEFRKIHWDANGHGARCIKGELINRTQRSFDWIRVQFTLYNSVDAVIGVTSDLIIGCASEA